MCGCTRTCILMTPTMLQFVGLFHAHLVARYNRVKTFMSQPIFPHANTLLSIFYQTQTQTSQPILPDANMLCYMQSIASNQAVVNELTSPSLSLLRKRMSVEFRTTFILSSCTKTGEREETGEQPADKSWQQLIPAVHVLWCSNPNHHLDC